MHQLPLFPLNTLYLPGDRPNPMTMDDAFISLAKILKCTPYCLFHPSDKCIACGIIQLRWRVLSVNTLLRKTKRTQRVDGFIGATD